jgi:hypothetical protein
MNREQVSKRLKELEKIKYTHCYNKERVVNKPENFCISIFYEEWYLRIKERDFENKL